MRMQVCKAIVESNLEIHKMFKLEQPICSSSSASACIIPPKVNQCVKDICTSVFAYSTIHNIQEIGTTSVSIM